MKQLVLLCLCISLAVLACGQQPRYDATNTKNPPGAPDQLKVSLLNDKVYIVYKNQEIPSASIQSLDSLLKKMPGKEQLVVDFENNNGEPEKNRAIDAVLRQCQCHISKHSIKTNKQ